MILLWIRKVEEQEARENPKIKVDMASQDLKHLTSAEFVAGKPPEEQNKVNKIPTWFFVVLQFK